jgi:hypothetical protein
LATKFASLLHRASANSLRSPPRRVTTESTLLEEPGDAAVERANRLGLGKPSKTAARPGEAASKAQPVRAGPRMPAPPRMSPHSSRHTPLHRSSLLCHYGAAGTIGLPGSDQPSPPLRAFTATTGRAGWAGRTTRRHGGAGASGPRLERGPARHGEGSRAKTTFFYFPDFSRLLGFGL